MKPVFTLILVILFAGCASVSKQAPPKEALTSLQSHHIDIVSATYGTNVYFSDVTDRTIYLLNSQKEFSACPQWLHTDPNPGWNKAYVVIYTYKGKRYLFCSGENGQVSILSLIKNAH